MFNNIDNSGSQELKNTHRAPPVSFPWAIGGVTLAAATSSTAPPSPPPLAAVVRKARTAVGGSGASPLSLSRTRRGARCAPGVRERAKQEQNYATPSHPGTL